jgi:hypothetical protein
MHPLIWLWNLLIDHPDKDILILPDDVTAAFHRVLYHPSTMIVFASVFEEYLCVPAGSIFRGQEFASLQYLYAAWGTSSLVVRSVPFLVARTELTDRSYLSALPTNKERASFAQASKDALNPGAAVLRGPQLGALHPVSWMTRPMQMFDTKF